MKAYLSVFLCVQFCSAFPLESSWKRHEPPRYAYSPNSIQLKQFPRSEGELSRRQTNVQLRSEYQARYFALPVSIGSQRIYLNADTGSSDVWAVAPDYKCYQNHDGKTGGFSNQQAQSSCNFAASYKPDNNFKQIKDRYIATNYDDGNHGVYGIFGNAPLTLGDVTVNDAQIGLVQQTNMWNVGDTKIAGIFGLAYGDEADSQDGSKKTKKYEVVTSKLYKANPKRPDYFSLALSRDQSGTSNGGIFTLGGYPNLSDPAVNISAFYTTARVQHRYFTAWDLMINGYVAGGWNFFDGAGYHVIIDSGSSVMTLPTNVKRAIESTWVPKMGSDGSVECDAQLSKPFGVKISGFTYYISASDLMYHSPLGCFSAISEQKVGDVGVLGLPFLKNVLAIFDHGHSQLAFYPRQYYKS